MKRKKSKAALSKTLKKGIEQLSGISMDDVNVHYNSDKPTSLTAVAYAQCTNIHIAPDQEKHLPKEAWQAIQQQGRVKPTKQVSKADIVNDNKALEKEADIMGGKAVGAIRSK